jgi:hypothetical protein
LIEQGWSAGYASISKTRSLVTAARACLQRWWTDADASGVQAGLDSGFAAAHFELPLLL